MQSHRSPATRRFPISRLTIAEARAQFTKAEPTENAVILLDELYERDAEYRAHTADFRAALTTLRQGAPADVRRALDDLDSAAILRASRAAEIIARSFAA